ncbi:MAG: hypothetical protein Q8J66_10335 [Methylotenera sp.]|nr:hypothetical protein [Methylotenera sp.]
MHNQKSAKLSNICIVIPYFGKWPLWMPYYWETCRYNSTVNWLFYTDCGRPSNCPANVKVIDITYDSYCKLISKKFSITFSPINPYKLCDIKPLLGHLHEEELIGYDFWAFGDVDVVYGDLRAYFDEERLSTKDIFSTLARRVSGHLCLIRNTQDMRLAYQKVNNWQELITNNEHVAFDEKAYSKVYLRHKNSPKWVRSVAAIFDPWLQRAEFVEAFSTPNAKLNWVDGTKKFPNKWLWKMGRLTNDIDGDKIFPYFHFMVWKSLWTQESFSSQATNAENEIKSFTITVDGFR